MPIAKEIFTVLLFVMLGQESAHAGDRVYKCTQPNGSVTYSDKECAGSIQELDIKNAENYMERAQREARESRQRLNEAKDRAWAAEVDSRSSLQSIIAQQAKDCDDRASGSGISIGDSWSKVRAISLWSYPDKEMRHKNSNGILSYYIYECKSRAPVRLMFFNDILQSIDS